MKKNVFISYRSTPYSQLVSQGCKVVNNGEKCNVRIALECPVQNCTFKRASIFAHNQEYNCLLVPPIYMLPPNTILTPIDFYQKLVLLQSNISKSDSFVRFEINEDSYWTYLELEFWRKRSIKTRNNIYYNVWLDESGKIKFQSETIASMPKNEAKLYDRLLFYTSDEHRHDIALGRYSYCFVSSCPNCGKTSLYSISALKYLIKNELAVKCTHCCDASFAFRYYSKKRALITFDYHGKRNPIPPLSNDFVIDLLLKSNEEILDQVHLICMSHESFPEMIALSAAILLLKDQFLKLFKDSHLEMRTYQNGKIIRVPLS